MRERERERERVKYACARVFLYLCVYICMGTHTPTCNQLYVCFVSARPGYGWADTLDLCIVHQYCEILTKDRVQTLAEAACLWPVLCMCDGDVCLCLALAPPAASCMMMQWLVAILHKTLFHEREREREREERKERKLDSTSTRKHV